MPRLTEQQRVQLQRAATTTQFIIIAMINGVVIFAGIIFYLKRGDQGQPGLLTYLAAAMAIGLTALSFIMPRLMGRTNPIGDFQADQPMGQQLQTGGMMSAAILEGAAFLNIIAHFIDGSPISLVVTAALTGFMIWLIPGKHTFENMVAGL